MGGAAGTGPGMLTVGKPIATPVPASPSRRYHREGCRMEGNSVIPVLASLRRNHCREWGRSYQLLQSLSGRCCMEQRQSTDSREVHRYSSGSVFQQERL